MQFTPVMVFAIIALAAIVTLAASNHMLKRRNTVLQERLDVLHAMRDSAESRHRKELATLGIASSKLVARLIDAAEAEMKKRAENIETIIWSPGEPIPADLPPEVADFLRSLDSPPRRGAHPLDAILGDGDSRFRRTPTLDDMLKAALSKKAAKTNDDHFGGGTPLKNEPNDSDSDVAHGPNAADPAELHGGNSGAFNEQSPRAG